MRINNLKLHALAITIICAVVVVVYVALQPPASSTAAALANERFILLDHATWGRNCDADVAEALQKWQATADKKKPHIAADNNALSALSTLCDGKTVCQFVANSSTLGDEPLPGCYKRLALRYRCFATDRLTIKEFEQGKPVTLDCTAKPATTTNK